MKKKVLMGLVVGLVLVSVGVLATSAAVMTYPISVSGCAADATPQFCEMPFSVSVNTGSVLEAQYFVTGHCSSIKVHMYVDEVKKAESDWLGCLNSTAPVCSLPLYTGLLNLGAVSPGTHVVTLRAEGQVGGCNTGRLSSWGGRLEVHTSSIVPVSIDIKPGSDPNCVNFNDHGVIPAAILGSPDFDVTQIDPGSVMLEGRAVKAVGKSNKFLAHYEDVNDDGYLDLVVQIQDSDGAFVNGNGTAMLTGYLYDGSYIHGSDSICIVPPE